MKTYPLAALRTVALRTQGLHRADGPDPAPGRDVIYQAIDQIGCVQIDTLQMVTRSQYLALWSRLGTYDPADLDALICGPDRKLFEGWQHAACIIPLAEYRYQMPRQAHWRAATAQPTGTWASAPENARLLEAVLERIRREGPLRTTDFEGDGRPRGSWWDWKPAKHALENLYSRGDLMIDGRTHFQRRYELTERVLPEWVDRTETGVEARDRFWVERGARALGVCTPRQVGDYTMTILTRARPQVEALLKEGILVPVRSRFVDGQESDLLIHRENLPLLEQAADGALQAERTTFLSPFDSLWWANRRDEMLWGFEHLIEAYVPAPKRLYGYFSLPILHKDRLVGRLDPKLERKAGLLRLKNLVLEPGVKPDEELVSDVAAAMRDFLKFHRAKDLVVENSQPKGFGKKLLAALGGGS